MPANAPRSLTTAREILEKTTAFFASKGIASARLDAEILLSHVLGYDRLKLYLNLDRPLDEAEIDRARALVRRRATYEPVAYILGHKEFAGREFQVGPGVLVPRPDTEILVEEAGHEILQRFGSIDGPIRILEFGIGSGAIAITLACDIPAAHITATEISPAAAATAHANAETYGVADRVEILLQPDFTGISGPFHVIVSNPPYIDPADTASLAPDILNHEPHEALFADKHGLQWYEYLAGQAVKLVAPGGFISVEIGHNQAESVSRIFESAGLKQPRTVKDYAGHNRVVTAENPVRM